MKHKISRMNRSKVDKAARYRRKVAKRKLLLGLRKDPKSGYKTAKVR